MTLSVADDGLVLDRKHVDSTSAMTGDENGDCVESTYKLSGKASVRERSRMC